MKFFTKRYTIVMVYLGFLLTAIPLRAMDFDQFHLEETRMNVLSAVENIYNLATTPTILAVGMAVGMGSLYYWQAIMKRIKAAKKPLNNFLKVAASGYVVGAIIKAQHNELGQYLSDTNSLVQTGIKTIGKFWAPILVSIALSPLLT